MGLSQEELLALRKFKDYPDDDNIRFKEIIRQKLCADKRILHVLNHPTLDENTPDEYLGKALFPYYVVPGVATDAKNYICFETGFSETSEQNRLIKYGKIIFYVLCDQKTILDTETGISRHDLLAALIRDIFNWTNCFGQQAHLVKDTAGVIENQYTLRTLVFELKTTNAVLKTRNNQTTIVNNKVVK